MSDSLLEAIIFPIHVHVYYNNKKVKLYFRNDFDCRSKRDC